MTAVSGCNIRTGEAYWELSGPLPSVRTVSCRACKQTVMKGESVMVRDGRKLRFFYHTKCFTGDADPRTQEGGAYQSRPDYKLKTAPNVSSLEGPRAVKDPDGRTLGREIYKDKAPSVVGHGKWSVNSRGYQPNASALAASATSCASKQNSPIKSKKANSTVVSSHCSTAKNNTG